MDAEAQKALYEAFDMLADKLGADTIGSVLMDLTGMDEYAALDPESRDQANRTAMRWLRDNGHLPKRRRV